MKSDTYFVIRILVFGIGFGMIIGSTISYDAGLAWLYGYLLCWIFSYISYKDLENQFAKAQSEERK